MGELVSLKLQEVRLHNIAFLVDYIYTYMYHSLAPIAKDGVWIELTYSGGTNYTSHCGSRPRTARLIFLCDPLIQGLVSSFDQGSTCHTDKWTHDYIQPGLYYYSVCTQSYRGRLTSLKRTGMTMCVSTRSL